MANAYIDWNGTWAGDDYSKRFELPTRHGGEPDPDPRSYFDLYDEDMVSYGDLDNINKVLDFYGHPWGYEHENNGTGYLPLMIMSVSDPSFLWTDRVDSEQPFRWWNERKQKSYVYRYWQPKGNEHPLKWHHYDPETATFRFDKKPAIALREYEGMRKAMMYSPVSSDADDDDEGPPLPLENAVPTAPIPRVPLLW
jgi:hypothetical protein